MANQTQAETRAQEVAAPQCVDPALPYAQRMEAEEALNDELDGDFQDEVLDALDRDLFHLFNLADNVAIHQTCYADLVKQVAQTLRDFAPQAREAEVDIRALEPNALKAFLEQLGRLYKQLAPLAKQAKTLKAKTTRSPEASEMNSELKAAVEHQLEEVAQAYARVKQAIEAFQGPILEQTQALKRGVAADIARGKEWLKEESAAIMGSYGGTFLAHGNYCCGDLQAGESLVRQIEAFGERRILADLAKLNYKLTTQPPLAELNRSTINDTLRFPTCLVTGYDQVTVEGIPYFEGQAKSVKTYCWIGFPIEDAYVYAQSLSLQMLLLRMAFALPLGKLEISVLDPEEYGECVSDISALAKEVGMMHLFTHAAEVTRELQRLDESVGDLFKQGVLSGDTPTWEDYNEANPTKPLSYQVVVVDSLKQVPESGLMALQKLLQVGARAGVAVFLSKKAFNQCEEAADHDCAAAKVIYNMEFEDLDTWMTEDE